MEPDIRQVKRRIRSLRDDVGVSTGDMAEATGVSATEYEAMESGDAELTFTFLYRCGERLGVDMIELLTGESPHLTGYSVVKAGTGLKITRRAGFEYRHLAPNFSHKLAEPFVVTAPYSAEEQEGAIALSRHDGQEFDYVVSGHLRFAFEDHTEDLGPGDAVFYDSGRGHGMIAIGGEPCTFLAIVLKDADAAASR